MEIARLYDACRRSWGADTSYNEDYADTDRVTPAERSYGQCAVTSLVVHDYHPGEFLRATIRWNGTSAIHYWIESNEFGQLDFTWDQFPVYAARTNIERVGRADLLPRGNRWMSTRYELLLARVTRSLSLTPSVAGETLILS